MDEIPQDEIAKVGRSIVAHIAPQELLLYRMHSQEFFEDPARALLPPKEREDALGFGAGDAVQLVTPLVLLALNEVVRAIGAEVMRQLGEGARAGVRALILRLFGKPEQGAVELSPEELKRVYEVAHEVALANAGSDPALARRIADEISAALGSKAVPGRTSPLPMG
ncbi:hypothetical protein GGE65_008108 [Skermanella aerolata]|uniref:hypothetical protein n=1 Tax=Skermanella aerolata TaxID=393310 RepID=UPI003D213C7C